MLFFFVIEVVFIDFFWEVFYFCSIYKVLLEIGKVGREDESCLKY